MRILSVNVGLPRQVISDGQAISTGIYKSPVQGRVKLSRLNLEGDAQADLSVHGGPNKAVYAYPSEHYAWWQSKLPGIEMPWGMFGENLTMEGLLENEAHIGDRFQMGSTVLMITQPRLPCYKLAIRLGREDMPDQFLSSGRTGFYFAVVEEGELGEGDFVERIYQEPNRVSVSDIVRLCFGAGHREAQLVERALNVKALSPSWQMRIRKRLQRQTTEEPTS